MSKGKGKLVYLSIPALDGLKELGCRYITRGFDNKEHTSYNKAVLLLLKFVKIAEEIQLPKKIKKNKKEE